MLTDDEIKLRCPECGSSKVLVYEKTAFWVNTMEYYCNTVKQHDSDAECRCNECDWVGKREDMKETQ